MRLLLNSTRTAMVAHALHALQTPPPDPARIPDDDLLGATVVMITCSYKSQEFIRVGYWINNTYGEALPEGGSNASTSECTPVHGETPVRTHPASILLQ